MSSWAWVYLIYLDCSTNSYCGRHIWTSGPRMPPCASLPLKFAQHRRWRAHDFPAMYSRVSWHVAAGKCGGGRGHILYWLKIWNYAIMSLSWRYRKKQPCQIQRWNGENLIRLLFPLSLRDIIMQSCLYRKKSKCPQISLRNHVCSVTTCLVDRNFDMTCNYVFIVKSNTFHDEKGRVHTMYRVIGRRQAGNFEAGELGIDPSGS